MKESTSAGSARTIGPDAEAAFLGTKTAVRFLSPPWCSTGWHPLGKRAFIPLMFLYIAAEPLSAESERREASGWIDRSTRRWKAGNSAGPGEDRTTRPGS